MSRLDEVIEHLETNAWMGNEASCSEEMFSEILRAAKFGAAVLKAFEDKEFNGFPLAEKGEDRAFHVYHMASLARSQYNGKDGDE